MIRPFDACTQQAARSDARSGTGGAELQFGTTAGEACIRKKILDLRAEVVSEQENVGAADAEFVVQEVFEWAFSPFDACHHVSPGLLLPKHIDVGVIYT